MSDDIFTNFVAIESIPTAFLTSVSFRSRFIFEISVFWNLKFARLDVVAMSFITKVIGCP